jgi:hypothetical protein
VAGQTVAVGGVAAEADSGRGAANNRFSLSVSCGAVDYIERRKASAEVETRDPSGPQASRVLATTWCDLGGPSQPSALVHPAGLLPLQIYEVCHSSLLGRGASQAQAYSIAKMLTAGKLRWTHVDRTAVSVFLDAFGAEVRFIRYPTYCSSSSPASLD